MRDISFGNETVEDLTEKYDNIKPIKLKRFPMLGEIACGEPIFADEDRAHYIMADMDIDADFCLTAKGDSMINARIFNGDIVFIKEMPIVENGDIAAVIIDNEATLKRVYYYPEQGKLILNPENPTHAPLVYVGEEFNTIRILGRAVYFMSLVK
ncbi:MAG: XRE family transcriptional regulator [Ruminococcus sp.]|nr:XRE family transcriptional regulator [Ruminococcus sp.]